MDVLVVEQVDGTLKVYFVEEVSLNANNGGWVQGKEVGKNNSLGLPVGQVKAIASVPGT